MADAVLMTADRLAVLEPGELLVRIVRDGWTIPPDHIAIARANRALCHFEIAPGAYRGRAPDDRQAECLEGAA